MIHFLVNHWKIAMPIAVAILNIIALIAILFERRELRKASRASELASLEIDKLSASLAHSRATSLASIKDNANI